MSVHRHKEEDPEAIMKGTFLRRTRTRGNRYRVRFYWVSRLGQAIYNAYDSLILLFSLYRLRSNRSMHVVLDGFKPN